MIFSSDPPKSLKWLPKALFIAVVFRSFCSKFPVVCPCDTRVGKIKYFLVTRTNHAEGSSTDVHSCPSSAGEKISISSIREEKNYKRTDN